MSLNLDRMRFLVLQGLGQLETNNITNDDLDELLNMALWDIESRFPFESKEKVTTIALVADDYDYSISGVTNFEAIRSIAFVDSEGRRNKLAKTTRDWWDENFDDDEKGPPTKYFREGTTIFVYPIPRTEEVGLNIEVSFLESVASLVDGTKETTGLPRNWDELVVSGAIWRGQYIYNKDYESTIGAINIQSRSLRDAQTTRATENEDFRYARLNVLWDDPR